MSALLDVEGLQGVSDAVRLAVLVLAARTPSETGEVKIRTSELGRWLGLSASYVASAVLPALRRSGVVTVDVAEGEFGQDAGLKCRVLPLWAAQDMVGHPLALAKKEFATLLRLLEAVMAPGWAHRDGRVTPAGLLGTRTGRGAATDRLALLALVLEAREDGRVRQCGGRVDTKRGRAAATVARLLGCTATAGERVLERLEERGLVLRVRLRTASGLAARSRLMVPAVAAAHGRTPGDDVQEDRAETSGPVFSDPDVAAGPVQAPEPKLEPHFSGVLVAGEAEVTEPDVAAALHTSHPHLVTPVVSLQLSRGFSGEGRGAEGRRPERAGAGAGAERREVADDGPTAVGGDRSALRAERTPPAPLSPNIARRVPQTVLLLTELAGKVTRYQRDRLDRLVNGLLLDGEDDAMISARLRQRLAPLATGDASAPYRFRRDGLSWALSVGLPYRPGGMTQVPCRMRRCANLVLGRATDNVRCDECELAALEAVSHTAAQDVAPPPPLEVLAARINAAPPPHGSTTAADVPASLACPQAPAVVPSAVQEQIDVITSIDPRAGRLANEAARKLYALVPHDEETATEYRDQAPAAMATLTAVADRYADVLAAHYARRAAA
ncbi:hypothetical protein [Streptomyces youssoufiensis]